LSCDYRLLTVVEATPTAALRDSCLLSDHIFFFSSCLLLCNSPRLFFLFLYSLTVPFVINAKLLNIGARLVMNFMAVWSYFALCEVGDNLEDPFLPYDPNELPLQAIQQAFNARLLTLYKVPMQTQECRLIHNGPEVLDKGEQFEFAEVSPAAQSPERSIPSSGAGDSPEKQPEDSGDEQGTPARAAPGSSTSSCGFCPWLWCWEASAWQERRDRPAILLGGLLPSADRHRGERR